MRYVKIIKNLIKVLGERARDKDSSKSGLTITGNMQMVVGEAIVTYGIIEDEDVFNNNDYNEVDFEFFNTIEEVETNIEASYVEILELTDPVKLQLDLQLSKKTDIKDYDPEQEIDSQYNLKKIKEENMGGVKIISKKANVR